MPPIAYFGIESSTLSLVIDLLILFLVVLWGSLVYWTYADARRRIDDGLLILCATGASLFPFVGTIVYMILRPPEYLEDVRERELDLQAAEARLHEVEHTLCPHCDYRIERDFIRCPSCLRKLKERCTSCSRPLDRSWTICPYCETEVPSAKPARRNRGEGTGGRASEPPSSRSRRASTVAEEPASEIELELERPSRRRAGAAAVRAPEPTSLLSDAGEPGEKTESFAAGAEQNGTPDAAVPAETTRPRRSRRSADD